MKETDSIYPIALRKKAKKYKKYTRSLLKYPPLKSLIELAGYLEYEIPIWASIEDAVLYAVIGQMLSNSASASIIRHLYKNFGSSSKIFQWAGKNHHKIGPINGVSQKKRKALHEWLLYADSHPGAWKKWKNLPLAEYRREINTIWGFGRWSSDMMGIFHLGRMDIWPETDNGIKKVSRLVFGTDMHSEIKKYISGCETVTALYFWQLLNKNLLSRFKENRYG